MSRLAEHNSGFDEHYLADGRKAILTKSTLLCLIFHGVCKAAEAIHVFHNQ